MRVSVPVGRCGALTSSSYTNSSPFPSLRAVMLGLFPLSHARALLCSVFHLAAPRLLSRHSRQGCFCLKSESVHLQARSKCLPLGVPRLGLLLFLSLFSISFSRLAGGAFVFEGKLQNSQKAEQAREVIVHDGSPLICTFFLFFLSRLCFPSVVPRKRLGCMYIKIYIQTITDASSPFCKKPC